MLKLLLAVLVAAATAAGPADPAPHPCATATGTCTGTIAVPLNWDDPSSERIDVAFQRIPRHDTAHPATGTILANFGGLPSPSIGSPEQLQRYLDPLGPVLDHQDLVLVDVRGLGLSSPLACTGVDVQRPGTVADCGRQLGPRAGWFTLDQAARDADAVRAALGVPRLTLLGHSWGSELAQAYASRFPDRVAAVMLSGTVPARSDGYLPTLGPYQAQDLTQRVLDRLCAASPPCAALPGTTHDRLGRAAAAMRADGEDVGRLVALVETAPSTPLQSRDLDAALVARVEGDPAPLGRLLAAIAPPVPRPELPAAIAAPFLTYACSGAQLPFDRAASEPEREAQLATYYADRQPYSPFTRAEGEAGSGLANTADLCAHWPWLRESPPVDADAAPLDVPVLQMNGGLDPTAVDAESLGRRFPRQALVPIPGASHQTWTAPDPVDGTCAPDLLRAFLLDPQAPVTGGCDRTTLRPAGAFPLTAAGLPPARADLPPAAATLVAAAHATAVDATTPRHPADPPAGSEFTQPGVRGGTATGAADGTVGLAGYRFVADATVDGTIAIGADRLAAADLTVTTADGPHRLVLRWGLFDLDPAVTGSVDGVAFTATIPAF